MNKLLILFFVVGVSFAANYKISGVVSGATGKGPVYINIFDRESWIKKEPLQRLILKDGEKKLKFSFNYPKGEYGIFAFEDIDGNGKLSFGIFGPAEPAKMYGLTKLVLGPPAFEDFSFSVTANKSDIEIKF